MIDVQKGRFLEIFELIFEAYASQSGIFSVRKANTAPQNLFLPKRVTKGSKDHLYWLALVGLSDKRTDSMLLYPRFAKMFDRNPMLFERGRYPSIRRMTELFRRYKIGVPLQEIGFFLERKRHLDMFFDGDPLKIYEGAGDMATLMIKLKKVAKKNNVKNIFPGAQEKMYSLLGMFLWKIAGLEFADVIPVDVWVQSIAASTDVLTGSGRINFDALENRLRPLMTEVFLKYRHIPGAENTTWMLGKYGCRDCTRRSMSGLCPVFNQCQGPFKRTVHFKSRKHLGVITLPLELNGKAT